MNVRIRCRIRRMHVDGSRVRIEKLRIQNIRIRVDSALVISCFSFKYYITTDVSSKGNLPYANNCPLSNIALLVEKPKHD